MQPVNELTTARTELHQLKHLQRMLSSELTLHASQLKNFGALPPDQLVDELISFRARLVKLTKALPDHVAPQVASQTEISLNTLQAAILRTEPIEQAITTLSRVQTLTHLGQQNSGCLSACQSSAEQLRTRFKSLSTDNLPEGSAELTAALLPFQTLLRLVDSADEMSDEEWASDQELVHATWGRALAIAVARGKIRVSPAAAEVTPVTSAPTSTAVASLPPIEVAPRAINEATSVLPPSHADEPRNAPSAIIPALPTIRFFETSRHKSSAAVQRAIVPPNAEVNFRKTSADPIASASASASDKENIGQLAGRVLQADAAGRRVLLPQVILQLIQDDRTALAYHLVRAAEHRSDADTPVIQSWTMHAISLNRHLCYSQGEIARLLEEDLQQFSPDLLHSNNAEWKSGTEFFLRAAALIPALLASSPSAALILRSFRITPGLSHLYNYCSRVLTYGQQLNGQAADLFTPDCDLSKWSAEVARLQRAVEIWLPEMIQKYSGSHRKTLMFLDAHWTLVASPTVRHPEAARLWSKWQEVFRIVSKLLKPIHTGQETERNWVKSEIDRLTQCVRLESAVNESTTTVALGAISFPLEAMVAMIREAIDYASRWLRLCASKPAQGRTLASRDAEVLRDEILARTDGVLTELNAYNAAHISARSRAGVACLCRTIEHLRSIFSPDSTLALRENDPLQIINAELLKLPQLQLNENGLPTVDPITLENEILSYLSRNV